MSVYGSLVVADGAQLYWPMDETSGTTCAEAVTGATLTEHGTVTVGGGTSPRVGDDAVSYGGGYMDFTFPTALQTAPSAFTWECWFYLNTITGAHGPLKLGFGGSEVYNRPGLDVIRCDLFNSGGTPYTLDSPALGSTITGHWHHLVLTWASNTLSMYYDGVVVASMSTSGTLSAPSTGQVGESGNPWDGYIAEVSYYTAALTATQVADHYGAINGAAGATVTPQLIPFESTWKYDHYLQTVDGPDETQGYTRHTASYNDSAWVTGTAIVGWTIIHPTIETIRTGVPRQHEVWLRKTVGPVLSMTITTKADDFYWLYVNGYLVANGSSSDASVGSAISGPFTVPTAYLNVGGQNVIAYHVQNLTAALFGSGDRLMADLKVEMTSRGWVVGAMTMN